MLKTFANDPLEPAPDLPYGDGWEHVADELRLLDIKINMLLLSQQSNRTENPYEQFRGLVIPEEEVYQLLNAPGDKNRNDPEINELVENLSRLESHIQKRRGLSAESGIFLPLSYLSHIFNLSSFEEQCIIICLAVELHRKYEKLYAYLQDDVTCKNPTIDLAMRLLCATPGDRLAARMSFAPKGKLNRFFLKKEDALPSAGTSLAKILKLDERIMNFFLNSGQVDDSISSCAKISYPGEEIDPLLLGRDIQDQIRKFVETNFDSNNAPENKNIVFYLNGTSGAGKKLQVKHFCRYFNQSLMIIDLTRVAGSESPFSRLMETIGREAILQQVVLCFDNFNVLLEEDGAARKKIEELFEIIKTFAGIVFLLSESPWKPSDFGREHLIIDIELGLPEESERKRLWERFSEGFRFEAGVDWGTLAGKFRFTPGQIKDALITAQNNSYWRHTEDGHIKTEELYKACYMQAQHKLEKRASRIQPKYTWDDVILPPEQKELLHDACNQMKYRHVVYGEWGFQRKLSYGKGLSMLFSGPPGTGKTMSAQVVARELYMELYKIDLSQVVSKYIGETEKNLQMIFREAHLSNAILFFDETDALFGKRSEVKDSHDRYANIETAFLLQKMEEYDGITIMATNFKQNIDEAFMRRINFVIEFPFPDAEYREKIWRSMFPPEAPLDDDIDFDFIAGRFEIAGGNIKNIVVSAAFLAAEASERIGMKHIIRAAKYELRKIGKIFLKEDLGEYYNYLL
ncbi:ATPase [Desulfocucumis palustris]|uniref:ATPase n=1 Tax=Desulfocucumis palustris TaxID=1898651 RepID=A0A2L2XFC8_9FIRM|nr:ATP-binding protein [Desulfocucumis palustris]GBF34832.1 ATPase [Desulfocucumis palustris]